MSNILLISNGFIGDSILAASFADNCKKNGFGRVDLLVGFPHTIELLQNNPNIDNVYWSSIGPHPTIDPSIINTNNYGTIVNLPHLKFNQRPIDTFNDASVSLSELEYNYKLYVPSNNLPPKTKPRLAFQTDWHTRCFYRGNSRDVNYILERLEEKYEVFLVGGGTHYDINNNTPYEFLQHCSLIQSCDLFFGFPGGIHWIAGGVGCPTITTSDHVIKHYTNNGEFKGINFDDFKNQWMVHTSKHFSNNHILLPPDISDDEIINYLLNEYNI